MALRDISNVTQTLINLIERAFRVPEYWPSGTVPLVMAEPPSRTKTNGIGMFLYHITEDAHYKNLPGPGRDQPSIRYASMALTLHYQLSCYQSNATIEGGSSGLLEQQMMAIAMKILHDYPELDETTYVEGARDAFNVPITSPVFHLDLLGRSNRFRITFQPVSTSESISYWSTGDTPLSLSAYYEVSVVLLEPETSRTRTGRVLDYNVFSFVNGNPKILGCSNEVQFVSPVDSKVRTLILEPAQVPPAPAVLPPDVTPHQISLRGNDFLNSVTLRFSFAKWDETATTTVDWQVEKTATEIKCLVRESALGEDSGLPLAVVPGIYGVQVTSTSVKIKGDGTTWPVEMLSNVSPIAVVPRIDSLGVPPTLPDLATVTGFGFSHLSGLDEWVDLEVFVGPDRLTQSSGIPIPGEFQITSSTSFDYRLPSSLNSGDVLPFRVIGNGAESAPLWITVP
jgi:hypothetical protein